jgi:hypothetical protein
MARPTQIEVLRKQIAALQAEHLELSSQKRSGAEVGAMVDGMIAGWSAAGLQALGRDLARAANGEPVDPLTLRSAAPVAAAPPGVAQISLNLGPLLVAMLGPDAVKAAFAGVLATLPPGTDRAERLKRLEAIGAELDALERDEETMIVASGGAIERRPDARPQIILAVM